LPLRFIELAVEAVVERKDEVEVHLAYYSADLPWRSSSEQAALTTRVGAVLEELRLFVG
jgi:hypothetical protein